MKSLGKTATCFAFKTAHYNLLCTIKCYSERWLHHTQCRMSIFTLFIFLNIFFSVYFQVIYAQGKIKFKYDLIFSFAVSFFIGLILFVFLFIFFLFQMLTWKYWTTYVRPSNKKLSITEGKKILVANSCDKKCRKYDPESNDSIPSDWWFKNQSHIVQIFYWKCYNKLQIKLTFSFSFIKLH